MTVHPTKWPNYHEGDFVIRNYVFRSGEMLPELKLHYRTLGTATRNAFGKIINGVLLLQGNTGTGANWLRPSLADELFGAGQPLDATQFFIIMQDAIGRGGSSKSSDGLKGNFPHYRYHDMVESGYRLVTEGLGVGHLRLVIGSSMGGMHAWMWAEMYPDLMDGVVAISCQPVEISGRKLARPACPGRSDPPRPGLEQRLLRNENPRHYIYAAAGNFGTESPTRIQEMAPTLAAANALYERRLAEAAKGDANDALWAIEAIRDYNPEPDLDKIKAQVLLINDAEDHANPPELGTVERAMKRVKYGLYVLIPAGPNTHIGIDHCAEHPDHIENPVDAPLIERVNVQPAANEIRGDVGLEIGERQDKIGLQGENLINVGRREGAHARLLAASHSRRSRRCDLARRADKSFRRSLRLGRQFGSAGT
jgi:homoserine O-acetyltransferase/O-succinyltransferase